MNYKYHFITNFPPNYPFYKKIIANLMFFFGATIIHPRQNWLTKKDLKKTAKKIKKGDVVIVGGLRRLSKIFIDDIFTHVLIYIGKRKFIHAIADGVRVDSMHDVFCEYDSLIILRPNNYKKYKKTFIKTAIRQIGKPYNFEFTDKKNSFYCIQLINYCFQQSGLNLFKQKNAKSILYPKDLLNTDSKIIFSSHNIKISKNKISLLDNKNKIIAQKILSAVRKP
jgi:hypothetical protein